MGRPVRQERSGSPLAILVVGALLIGIAAYGATQVWGTDPEIEAGEDDVGPDRATTGDAEAIHRERTVLARAAVPNPQERSLIVVDEVGVPIADVFVGVRSRWSTDAVTGVTDEEGRFDCVLPDTDENAPLLGVYTDRTGSTVARPRQAESGSYTVTLPGQLPVRVVDDQGTAVPGAEVWSLTAGPMEVCRRLGVADGEGRLLLRGIGRGVRLRAESEGGRPGQWTRVEDGEATLTIGTTARTIVVEVRNEAGEALAGAIVRASGQDARWSDVGGTKDNGRASIRYPGPMPLDGRQAKIMVEVAGYAPAQVLPTLSSEPVSVVCHPGHGVGFLVKAGGDALSGASVAWNGMVRRVVETNEEGYCELFDLPLGIAAFSVSYSGATEERSFPVREGLTHFSWDLEETESIGGRVTVAGRPAVGWTVVLADWLSGDARSVQTDALGGFLFLECPSEAGYEVVVREPRRNASVWRRRCAPGERLDVALPASTLDLASISGVFLGPDGTPVEENVIVRSTSGDVRVVQMPRGGTFRFDDLPAGDYVISALPPGWKTPIEVTRSLYPGQVESVELRSSAPAKVVVEVTEAPEAPEALERLSATLWCDGAWRRLSRLDTTRWEMSGVAPGEHWIRMFGMAPTTLAVTLKAGETETVGVDYRSAQPVEVILSGPEELARRDDLVVYFVDGKCDVRARRIRGEATWIAELRNGTRYAVEVRTSIREGRRRRERVWAKGEVSVPGVHDENAVLLESHVVKLDW